MEKKSNLYDSLKNNDYFLGCLLAGWYYYGFVFCKELYKNMMADRGLVDNAG